MNSQDAALGEWTEDFFEDAPCGFVSTDPDWRIVRVNRTFERWTGFSRDELLAGRRFQDLLSPGARIYHQTHVDPLLWMQGSVSEIAVEIVRSDQTRMPTLLNSALRRDQAGRPRAISTMLFDATDRRSYEQELLRAQRHEHAIAQQLQQSLMPGVIPSDPGLDIEVVYRPSTVGLDVGGDWYDAFWLDDSHETVGLVVGDVVGHGLDAAATMGQLRSAVRALAATGLRPGPLLDTLDNYSRRYQIGQGATLVYAQLSLAYGELRFACAGHPPPVIIVPDEEPHLDWEGRSTPLDTYRAGAPPRDETMRVLMPGSMVLFYTDGLVEQRSRPDEDGLDRLVGQIASRQSSVTGVTLGSRLVRALTDRDSTDDVCMLLAGLTLS